MAGQPRGPNKNKQALKLLLQKKYGEDFNAVMKVAEQAVKLVEMADADICDVNARKAALDGWDKVAQYVEPKLKAVEVSGPDDENGLPTAIRIEIVKHGA